VQIKRAPLNFKSPSVRFAKLRIFFTLEVNTVARIRIIPCPRANKNSISVADSKFSEKDATATAMKKIGHELIILFGESFMTLANIIHKERQVFK